MGRLNWRLLEVLFLFPHPWLTVMFYLTPQDVEKCIAIMEDLEALPVNHIILKKNPDIMNTIKKVSLGLLLGLVAVKVFKGLFPAMLGRRSLPKLGC